MYKKNKRLAIISSLLLILLLPLVTAEELQVLVPHSYKEVDAGNQVWFITSIPEISGTAVLSYTLQCGEKSTEKISEVYNIETDKNVSSFIEIPIDFDGNCQVKVQLEYAKNTLSRTEEIIIRPYSGQSGNTAQFEIYVDIPQSHHKITPNQVALASIKLVNRGTVNRVDVFLDYWISDASEEVVIKKKETVAVETQAQFVRSLTLPEGSPQGSYTFHARITYANGDFADAQQSFIVSSKNPLAIINILGLIIVVCILALILFIGLKKKGTFMRIQLRSKIKKIVKKKLSQT